MTNTSISNYYRNIWPNNAKGPTYAKLSSLRCGSVLMVVGSSCKERKVCDVQLPQASIVSSYHKQDIRTSKWLLKRLRYSKLVRFPISIGSSKAGRRNNSTHKSA